MNLSKGLISILERDINNLSFPHAQKKWLNTEEVDHLAIAFPGLEEFDSFYRELSRTHSVVEDKHIWPTGITGCPQVPITDIKYMASFKVNDTHLVLLCPYSSDDVIDRFVCNAGGAALHHIALRVPNLTTTLKKLMHDFSSIRQITPVASDPGYMSQVFLQMGIGDDARIIELLERENNFEATFTCNNVRQLTEGERLNWRSH